MSNIILFQCAPRSGGTLFSKILKTSEDVILLSEISLKVGVDTSHNIVPVCDAIKNQVREWYSIELEGDNLTEVISDLVNFCEKNNKTLIVREWSFQSFFPSEGNNFNPTLEFSLLNFLERKYNVISFAFVRDSIDVYLSMGLDIDIFVKYYRKYTELLVTKEIKIFKYEQLINNSDLLQELSNYLKNNFCFDMDNFCHMSSTGDTQLGNSSRGGGKKYLARLPRKFVYPWHRYRINHSKELEICNNLLGYSVSYQSSTSEWFFSYLFFKIKRRFSK